jgi:hypothetical protein
MAQDKDVVQIGETESQVLNDVVHEALAGLGGVS